MESSGAQPDDEQGGRREKSKIIEETYLFGIAMRRAMPLDRGVCSAVELE